MKNIIALTLVILSGCYSSQDATRGVRYELVAQHTDWDGALSACAAIGGRPADVHATNSIQQILEACSAGLPDDRTPCWTGIAIDRPGPALTYVLAPQQPTMNGFDVDHVFQPGQGYYVVCEVPE